MWGQFSVSDMSFFSNIQKIVNLKLKGPKFEIHITLTGPLLKYTKEKKSILKQLSLKTKSFNLNIHNYCLMDEKYTALLIKIKKSKKLIDLKNKLENKLKIISSDYCPHISLYYGTKKKEQKIKVIELLPKLPKKIILKNLCLVDYDETINKWKILEKFSLV